MSALTVRLTLYIGLVTGSQGKTVRGGITDKGSNISKSSLVLSGGVISSMLLPTSTAESVACELKV